jgi:NADPH2:quinone reductase
MRAVVVHQFGPADTLKVEDFPAPQPAAGEVLIDIHAIGLNFSDRLMMEGKYQVRPDRPFVPGRDVCGVVAKVGAGVTRCQPGDRVLSVLPFGAYAEQAVSPQIRCWPIPDRLDFIDGAALGNSSITAYLAATQGGQVKPGQWVLVTGASGGVGLAGVELVKALGARAIAGVTSKDKGELAMRHGAEAWVDLKAPNLPDSLREQVQKVAGPQGVHCVLDVVGGDVFDAALRALAPGGRIVVIGFAGGRIAEAKTNYLLLKNLAVVGFHVEPYIREQPELVEDAMADLFALYERGKLKPEVSAVHPLEQFQTALAGFGKGGIEGKVVLTTARS